MLFEKGKLQSILKEHNIKDSNDLQNFMREMTKEVIETLYHGEIESHLGYKKNDQSPKETSNRRNGSFSKTVNTKSGEIELAVPRDRDGDFEPQIVKKRQTEITRTKKVRGMEDKVISLYARGMSTRDIQDHIYDIYGYDMSPETVSNITDISDRTSAH